MLLLQLVPLLPQLAQPLVALPLPEVDCQAQVGGCLLCPLLQLLQAREPLPQLVQQLPSSKVRIVAVLLALQAQFSPIQAVRMPLLRAQALSSVMLQEQLLQQEEWEQRQQALPVLLLPGVGAAVATMAQGCCCPLSTELSALGQQSSTAIMPLPPPQEMLASVEPPGAAVVAGGTPAPVLPVRGVGRDRKSVV